MTQELMPQMSDKFDIVLSKLMAAKQKIGTVKKDSKNPFHKSNYASLNAYIDASEDHLLENGLILLQAGNGSYMEPMIVATLVHPESGQWLKSYFPILNPKQDSQGLGASVTYMRRYSIATLLGLVSEDDDGETAVGRGKFDQKKKTQPAPPPTEPKPECDNLGTILEFIDIEDHALFNDYTQVVMKHFGWNQQQCISKFMDDKDFKIKFSKWKAKAK